PLSRLRRPAVETMEAFLVASQLTGPIRRVPGAAEDKTTPKCAACGLRRARPMAPADALDVREAARRAGVDDRAAFAFARTTILLTESTWRRLCVCDQRAWENAIVDYTGPGSWAALGVTP